MPADSNPSRAQAMLDDVAAKLDAQYGRQVEACRALRDVTIDMVMPWSGRPLGADKQHEWLMAAIFTRSLNTFWAATELGGLGFGEQTAMLNRSLFEDMVDAHWVSMEPATAVERFEQHLTHGQMLMADALRSYPDFISETDLATFDAEKRKALDRVFGRYGAKSWTGLNLHERVEAIEHLWPFDRDRQTLRFYRDIAHRENNQTLHLSAQGLAAMLRSRQPEGLNFKIGPGSEMLDRGLFGAFWTFGQTISLIVDEFEMPGKDALETNLLHMSAFVQPSADELAAAGRNDPCPCGSGKKFKRCHGA